MIPRGETAGAAGFHWRAAAHGRRNQSIVDIFAEGASIGADDQGWPGREAHVATAGATIWAAAVAIAAGAGVQLGRAGQADLPKPLTDHEDGEDHGPEA